MKVQSTHAVVVERTKRALAMKAEGKDLAEIARELGVTTGGLHYYLYTVSKSLEKEPNKPGPKRRGVVSVLGSTTVMNGKSHHDWFVAGWLASYATANHLDVDSLLEDAERILEGKEAQ